jgi:hypothetical protein
VIGLFKEVDELRTGWGSRTMRNPGCNVVGISGTIHARFATDRQFDLAFEHRTPLAFVTVRRYLDVFLKISKKTNCPCADCTTLVFTSVEAKGSSASGKRVMMSGSSIASPVTARVQMWSQVALAVMFRICQA